MITKLTLTIDKEVIQSAKGYAKGKGQSLSEIVENYLKLITAERKSMREKQLSPKVRKLRGILKVDPIQDYKSIFAEELSKKYGYDIIFCGFKFTRPIDFEFQRR